MLIFYDPGSGAIVQVIDEYPPDSVPPQPGLDAMEVSAEEAAALAPRYRLHDCRVDLAAGVPTLRRPEAWPQRPPPAPRYGTPSAQTSGPKRDRLVAEVALRVVERLVREGRVGGPA